MNAQAIAAIRALSSNFLMEDNIAATLLPLAMKMLFDPQAQAMAGNMETPTLATYAINGDPSTGFSGYTLEQAPAQSIAVVEVRGPLMKESSCFSAGTKELMSQSLAAAAHPNIAAVMFVFDTGGGSVAGTEVFANAIKSISQDYGKPTLGMVEDLAASAGYWLLSACDEIYAYSESSMVGSIGTAIAVNDMSSMLEKMGVKEHYVTATASAEKNKDVIEAKAGNYGPIRKNMLDPINEVFRNAVITNRPNLAIDLKTEAPVNGAMYMAQEAVNIGLLDGICSMQEAVNKLHHRIHS
ncbi:Peptidase family S49 [Flexibacter flexilis DSM 6793]|uniref:Peptidase family S49 n=1 Tax=Flexibacter flexilis DSM 6793 TaxID=927664 RepID=A0A1I1NNJ0_9BACT|nr:S49 family peptidase [Flexibacter flexilis]SFC95310.1 Peptidase family S49 [Flexibacter flexilis DSM 6793]